MIRRVIKVLGSWAMFAFLAVGSTAWAAWNRIRHRPQDTLDIVISIGTMLMDVIVIIAMNESTDEHTLTLKQIMKKLDEKS